MAGRLRARLGRRVRDESGVSMVEVIVITPVFLFFLLSMLWILLRVDNVNQVQQAAADAARMGSLQQPLSDVDLDQQVQNAAEADLGSLCGSGPGGLTVTPQIVPYQYGNLFQVTVTCEVHQLAFPAYTLTRTSSVPIDVYRGPLP
jgi:Flp pilus assembly protein TadG